MIQAITDAEARALQIKNEAAQKAEAVIFAAHEQAASLKTSSEEVLKAYKDTQLSTAKAQAEVLYGEEISKAKKNAQNYCAEVLQNAEVAITDIVGRVVRGNR